MKLKMLYVFTVLIFTLNYLINMVWLPHQLPIGIPIFCAVITIAFLIWLYIEIFIRNRRHNNKI